MQNEYINPEEIRDQIDHKLNKADWYQYIGFGVAFLAFEALFLMATGRNFGWEHVAIAMVAAAAGRSAFKYGTRSKKNMEWLIKGEINKRPVRIKKE